MQDFLKEIFTLKTVYIDRGAGRWVIRKRLHPFMRYVLLFLLVTVCGVVFAKSGTEAVVINNEPAKVHAVKLIEPEPVQPPVKINIPYVAAAEPKPVLIPVSKKNAPVTKREIILPSEANPDTDKIIASPKKNPSDKYRIVVSKSDYTLSLLKGDELVKKYPVAVGKNTGDKERVGDHRTPVGKFKIVSIENASSWSHDFKDGKGKIAGAYGPWFLRLDAKGWRGIGIHGTHDPDSRGTNATEGCIRLSNEDISELKEKYAYRNMPVEIREK